MFEFIWFFGIVIVTLLIWRWLSTHQTRHPKPPTFLVIRPKTFTESFKLQQLEVVAPELPEFKR